jgi:hypothetical protein
VPSQPIRDGRARGPPAWPQSGPTPQRHQHRLARAYEAPTRRPQPHPGRRLRTAAPNHIAVLTGARHLSRQKYGAICAMKSPIECAMRPSPNMPARSKLPGSPGGGGYGRPKAQPDSQPAEPTDCLRLSHGSSLSASCWCAPGCGTTMRPRGCTVGVVAGAALGAHCAVCSSDRSRHIG